jgi:Ca2+-binding EF-hand superfamily protein
MINITQIFDPNQYINKYMDLDTILQLKSTFDIFDYDHNGLISLNEIDDTVKDLGLENYAKNIVKVI